MVNCPFCEYPLVMVPLPELKFARTSAGVSFAMDTEKVPT